MPDGLIYVPLPRATVGLMVVAGVVADVPPYVRRRGWEGRDARQVWRELRREGVAVEWVPAGRMAA
jgi:hypothetical protein